MSVDVNGFTIVSPAVDEGSDNLILSAREASTRLRRQPVKLTTGEIATVRSIGVGDDKGEWVIPTIVDGKPVSNDTAVQLWKQGKNPPIGGPFTTQEESDRFAQAFHEAEAQRIENRRVDENGFKIVRNETPSEVPAPYRAASISAFDDLGLGQLASEGAPTPTLGIERIPVPAGKTPLGVAGRAAERTALGLGASLTSPQTVGEIIGTTTPLAPLVYAKWVGEMVQSGKHSLKEIRENLTNLISEHINQRMASAVGEPHPEMLGVDEQSKREQIQAIADHIFNVALSAVGVVGAGRAGVKSVKQTVAGLRPEKGENAIHGETEEVLRPVPAQPGESPGEMPVTEGQQTPGRGSPENANPPAQALPQLQAQEVAKPPQERGLIQEGINIAEPIETSSIAHPREILTVENVAFDKKYQKNKEAAYRPITEAEAADPAKLGRLVTTDWRYLPTTLVSNTKRLLAVEDKETGQVHVLSVYRNPRSGAMIMDPDTGKNVQFGKFIGDYKPLYSILLREPVQKYAQTFKNLADYQNQFGNAVAEKAGQTFGEIKGVPETIGPAEEIREPAEIPEIEAPAAVSPLPSSGDLIQAYNVLSGLPGSVTPELLARRLNELAQTQRGSVGTRQVSNAVKKISQYIIDNEGLEPEAAIAKAIETLHENTKVAGSAETFAQSVLRRFPERTGESLEAEALPEVQGKGLGWRTRARLESEALGGEAGGGHLPSILRDIGRYGSRFVDSAVAEPLRLYSEWMTERLGRMGGPRSKYAQGIFNKIIDRQKELYGSLTNLLDPARKEAGRLNAGTRWLHGIKEITPFAGTSRTVDAIEGKIAIPPEAQKAIDSGRAANLAIGQMLQPLISGFIATGKFQRNVTAYGYDIIRQGSGEAWRKWTTGLARANKVPLRAVRQFFAQWKAVLDDPLSDATMVEKVNQDFARKFPEVITHIRQAGQWQPVIHADLFNYLENAAQRASHIRAFREQFPATTDGRQQFRDLIKDMRSELPPSAQSDITGLVRSLQGHPTDSYSHLGPLSPGQPVGEAFRFVNRTMGNLMARMVLTGQMFVQPGENIAGSTPVFLGYRNYLEGMARLKQLYPELEKQGAVNRVMYDWSFNPTSPVQSLFRIAGNVLSRGFGEQLLNELQEASAAATARVVTDRIRNNNLSDWERRQLPQTFKDMGFSESEVNRMMGGDPELLGQFERKAAAFLTSGNKAIAEGSRLGANRLVNSIFRFQTYPMMKMNQFRKVTGNLLDAWRDGTTTERVAASEQFARFMFGTAAQGALTVAITSLFFQGPAGTKIRLEEAKDEPGKFLLESFLATMGGPLYLLWSATRDKGVAGIGEQATRLIFPYVMLKDLIDMTQGRGVYRDLDLNQRIGKFVEQKIPGSRAIRQGLSLFGLSSEDTALEAAIKGFYRWRRDALGSSDYQPFLKDDDRKEFRTAVKQMIDAMKRNDQEAYNKARERAYGAGFGDIDITRSMQGRKILKNIDGKALTEDQMSALRKHIGDEAVNRLEAFDAMLDGGGF